MKKSGYFIKIRKLLNEYYTSAREGENLDTKITYLKEFKELRELMNTWEKTLPEYDMLDQIIPDRVQKEKNRMNCLKKEMTDCYMNLILNSKRYLSLNVCDKVFSPKEKGENCSDDVSTFKFFKELQETQRKISFILEKCSVVGVVSISPSFEEIITRKSQEITIFGNKLLRRLNYIDGCINNFIRFFETLTTFYLLEEYTSVSTIDEYLAKKKSVHQEIQRLLRRSFKRSVVSSRIEEENLLEDKILNKFEELKSLSYEIYCEYTNIVGRIQKVKKRLIDDYHQDETGMGIKLVIVVTNFESVISEGFKEHNRLKKTSMDRIKMNFYVHRIIETGINYIVIGKEFFRVLHGKADRYEYCKEKDCYSYSSSIEYEMGKIVSKESKMSHPKLQELADHSIFQCDFEVGFLSDIDESKAIGEGAYGSIFPFDEDQTMVVKRIRISSAEYLQKAIQEVKFPF